MNANAEQMLALIVVLLALAGCVCVGVLVLGATRPHIEPLCERDTERIPRSRPR